jgi:hypothetical protein
MRCAEPVGVAVAGIDAEQCQVGHVVAGVAGQRGVDRGGDRLDGLGEQQLPHAEDHLVVGVAQLPFPGCLVGGEQQLAHHHLEHRVDDELVLLRVAQHRLGRHRAGP